MKKLITFGKNVATLERSKTAGILEVTTLADPKPFNMKLAELADAMNEAECINVHTTLPVRGKIIFTTKKRTNDTDLVESICDAITRVLDTDTVVSNERAEEII